MSLIEIIQKQAIDANSDVNSLLLSAKLAASKLGQIDSVKWIKKELTGYSSSTDPLPEYRIIQCRPQFFNDVHRKWFPLICDELNTARITDGAGKIQELIRQQDGDPSILITGELRDYICRGLRFETDVRLLLDKANLKAILDEDRHKILDWTIELERNGIKGEGLSFPQEQIDRGKHLTITINNSGHMNGFGFGDNATISANQITKSNVTMDANKINEILSQLEPIINHIGLEEEKRREAEKTITELRQELDKSILDDGKCKSNLDFLKEILIQAGAPLITNGLVQAIQGLLSP